MVLYPLIFFSSHPLYYIIETVISKGKVLTPNTGTFLLFDHDSNFIL